MAHQPFNLKNVLLWAAIALGGFTFQACSNDDDYPTSGWSESNDFINIRPDSCRTRTYLQHHR